MSSTDPTLDQRANIVLVVSRLRELGWLEAAPEDRPGIEAQLLADVTEPAPYDGPER